MDIELAERLAWVWSTMNRAERMEVYKRICDSYGADSGIAERCQAEIDIKGKARGA